jgi:UDP-N-acetylglucosamine 2-epimerase
MSPGTILTAVGTLPHYIKAAPVSSGLERAALREILVHTGQRREIAECGAGGAVACIASLLASAKAVTE